MNNMGKMKLPRPVLLFVGTLYSDINVFNNSVGVLEKHFGEILTISPPLLWNYSSYYRDEIGWPIYRQFIFFKKLVDPGLLSDIKLTTNSIENEKSTNGKRHINIDPGYMSLSKIVLASTKNYAHRIYLGKGIYGEVTLIYRDKTYHPHLYTYRDYQDKEYIKLFLSVRQYLKKIQSS